MCRAEQAIEQHSAEPKRDDNSKVDMSHDLAYVNISTSMERGILRVMSKVRKVDV